MTNRERQGERIVDYCMVLWKKKMREEGKIMFGFYELSTERA
jgi:hypothetical protein